MQNNWTQKRAEDRVTFAIPIESPIWGQSFFTLVWTLSQNLNVWDPHQGISAIVTHIHFAHNPVRGQIWDNFEKHTGLQQ
jgi:hypothetical protein